MITAGFFSHLTSAPQAPGTAWPGWSSRRDSVSYAAALSTCDSVKWDTWELATSKGSRTCGWLQSVNISKLGLFLKFSMPGLKFQPLKQTRAITFVVPLLKRKKSCFWHRGLCGMPAGAKGFILLHNFQGQEKPLQNRVMAKKCLWFPLGQTSNSVFL